MPIVPRLKRASEEDEAASATDSDTYQFRDLREQERSKAHAKTCSVQAET